MRVVRGLTAAVLALLVLGTGAAAAVALTDAAPTGSDHGGLSLSADGRAWAEDLSHDLFAEDLLVPGGSVERTVWVRNDSRVPAAVSIDIAPHTPATGDGADLGDWLTVRLRGHAVDAGERWRGPALQPGGVARVPVQVVLAPDAPTSTRASVAQVLDAVHLVAVVRDEEIAPTPSPSSSTAVAAPTTPGLVPTASASAVPEPVDPRVADPRDTAGWTAQGRLPTTGASSVAWLAVALGATGSLVRWAVVRRNARS